MTRPAEDSARSPQRAPRPTLPALIVGVGASAGGLDAFTELLGALPAHTGMAFILVQHLDPRHDSSLTQLLASHCSLAVVTAEHGAVLAPDTVYVIQPDTDLGVDNGRLEVSVPTMYRGVHRPVDHLFRSLARTQGSRAAGVVLSGAGRDGTAGLRELKAAGGLAMAQRPDTAIQSGMPQSAIDAGVVDLVLPIAEMPAALARFATLLHAGAGASEDAVGEPANTLADDVLDRLAEILGTQGDLDVRRYKSATIERRTLRRMGLAGFDDIEPYLEHLQGSQAEQHALVGDLLISVTHFFRDAEAFDALTKLVISEIIAAAEANDTIRVWVPGCATGEEAYSVAMTLLEAIDAQPKKLALQIFATDVDEEALRVARAGIYPESIAEQVADSRLDRFFTELHGNGYQVRPRLRDVISFAVHDLCGDPPFSRMDLITCRNVLIYLRPPAQEEVLRALHFALEPTGYLFLGSSESIGALRELFTVISKPWRIFQRAGAARPVFLGRSSAAAQARAGHGGRPSRSLLGRAQTAEVSVASLARDAILESRVPPSVVVSDEGRVLYVHGDLGSYLHYPKGEPRFDLLSDLRADLVTRVRAALYKCRRDGKTVVVLSSPDQRGAPPTRITASPAPHVGDGAAVLTFERIEAVDTPVRPPTIESREQESLIEQLERELQATREDLRNTVEELESANEELRTSNEESMSMNEELQSANEELEAMTEELRSLNEELATINSQLKEKVEQLEHAHDDLSNFFASTKLATLFLDDAQRIKRCTPAAEDLLLISHDDLGRHIADIARELLQMELKHDVHAVLSDLIPQSREVQAADGRWFMRRVLPYRTETRRIEGVVVTWMDVTELKRATERLSVRERQQAVIARLGLRALSGEDLALFMAQVVREVQQTLGSDVCGILQLERDTEMLVLEAGVGWPEDVLDHAAVAMSLDSHAGYTLAIGEPVMVEDLGAEKRFSGSPLLLDHGVVSGLTCVIQDGDAPYGVLGAHTRTRRAFGEDDANFLQAVANLLAAAVSRKQTRERLAVESGVAKVLSESPSLEDAAPHIVAVFARELGVTLGELWRPTPGGDALERVRFLAAEEPYRQDELARFFAAGPFRKGEGLPGRAWERGQAEWLSDLSDERRFTRAKLARDLELRSGIALPIASNGEVIAVMSVFSKRRLIPDRVFMHGLEAIGRALGEFVRRTEAETATRLSEERLRLAVQAAAAMVFEADVDADLLTSLHGVESILGESVQTPVPLSWWTDRIHPDDQARPREAILRAQAEDLAAPAPVLEYRIRHRDGHHVFVEVHARMVREDGGRLRRIGVVLDISDRKRAEAELSERERRLRLAVQATDAGVFAHAIPAGDELYVSERWLTFLGLGSQDVPAPQRFHDWFLNQIVHPDDRKRYARAYGDFLAGRVPKHDAEARLHHQHGHWLWARIMADAAERGEDGRVTRITGLMWDVTQAKEAERRLRDSEESFRILAESIPHLVWTATADGANDYYNARALQFLGCSLADLAAPEAWLATVHPDDQAAADAAWKHSLQSGAEFRVDFRILRAVDGAYLWHAVHALPMRDERGNVSRWFGTCTNIHTRKEAEDRLRESELRLQRTFEGSPLGIAFAHMDGRITRCNQALLTLLGHERREDLDWCQIVPPERAAEERAAAAVLQREGRHGPVEKELLRKDGSRVTVLASAVTIGIDDEHVSFIVDLTEQKQIQRELAKLAAIVESTDDAILSKDPDGVILSWNRGAEELYGYAPVEAIGQHVSLLVPPERRPELDMLMARLHRGERIEQHETVRQRKDGARVDISVTISPIRDDRGRIIGASTLARDITARKRAEALLRESEDRYRVQAAELEAIYATLPVGLALSDREHRYLRINQRLAELNGLPLDAHLGRRAYELFPQLEDVVGGYIDHVFATGETVMNREFSGEPQGGRPRYWMCSYAPVKDAQGEIRAVSCVVQDITERKQAEQALRDASEQKDHFLAMLGHELRNPLAAIRGAAELLKLTHGGDARLQRTQSILDRQTAHMAKLLDGLLDVSRIIRGKITLETEIVDVTAIVRDLMQDHAEQVERRGLAFQLELPARPLWILGDRVRLAQVFGNLLANALQFTVAPGTLTISGEADDGMAVITVRDTGIGIGPDLLPHIFEPFRQGAQAIDRSTGGLGLGLALVKGLVELHGGEIHAWSDGPGHGAVFTLRFPLVQEAPAAERKPERRGPRRLLVVEDNIDMAELLRDMLMRSGHDVVLAYNGAQALAMAIELEPDFVLCDIGLPGGMSGYDLARAIRKQERLQGVFLVALTGYGRPEDRADAEAVGFDAHLTKPVSMTAIENLLARDQE
jgi:two-component system CheB/CheR fusion protein